MKSKEVVGAVDKLCGVRKLLGPDGEKPDRNTLWSFLRRLIDSLGFHLCTTTL
jgi:hypothetical protein